MINIIIANNYHPLYSKVQALADVFLNISDPDWENHEAFKKPHLIFDFCVNSGSEKEAIFQKLNFISSAPIISDLACHWGDYFIKRYPIAAAHSASFYSPKNKIEIKLIDQSLKNHIEDFFQKLELELLYVTEAGIGFHYPRTISMIINEAFLAYEDHLAETKDIDQAMKYGVNYPQGPFEWAEKIGPRPLVMLLDELYQVTGSPRYRVSPKLRSEMLLGSYL
jgi:3-hydroxybutyryl-CoA dehydrogenase